MRDIDWKPIATAPKDGTSFLVYIPRQSSSLQTRGLYTMHWSGWGGGVWEAGNGWRPFEDEVRDAMWAQLDPIVWSAKAAIASMPPACQHEWIDIRNSIIKNGSMCIKCRALRAENFDQ